MSLDLIFAKVGAELYRIEVKASSALQNQMQPVADSFGVARGRTLQADA
jgi:hypothetical protein